LRFQNWVRGCGVGLYAGFPDRRANFAFCFFLIGLAGKEFSIPQTHGQAAAARRDFAVPFDQLRQREQERRIRSLGFAVSGLAILTTVVLGLGVLAELNRERATAERNHALQSQSLLLTDFAHREIDQGNAVAGMLLALEGLPRDIKRPDRPVVPGAVEALYDGVLARRELAVLKVGSEIESASMSADGQRVLTVTKSGDAQLWDRTGAPVATLGNREESVCRRDRPPRP
jgi:hypothetical protein